MESNFICDIAVTLSKSLNLRFGLFSQQVDGHTLDHAKFLVSNYSFFLQTQQFHVIM